MSSRVCRLDLTGTSQRIRYSRCDIGRLGFSTLAGDCGVAITNPGWIIAFEADSNMTSEWTATTISFGIAPKQRHNDFMQTGENTGLKASEIPPDGIRELEPTTCVNRMIYPAHMG